MDEVGKMAMVMGTALMVNTELRSRLTYLLISFRITMARRD